MVNIKPEGVEQTRREHSGVTQTTLGCQRRLARGSWVHTQGKRRSKPGTGAVLGHPGVKRHRSCQSERQRSCRHRDSTYDLNVRTLY